MVEKTRKRRFFRKKEDIDVNQSVEGNESKSLFRDLLPNDSITNGEEYFEALKWALHNERVTNIAITGPYGAGKSSVISSFLKLNPEYKSKCVRISLASFKGNRTKINEGSQESLDASKRNNKEQGEKPDSNENERKDDGHISDTALEKELERGILKQLFYHANYEDIPQSRYHKLHVVRERRITWGIVLLFVLVAGIFFFFERDKFISTYKSISDGITYFDNVFWSIIAVLLFLLLMMGLIKVLSKAVRVCFSHLSGFEINLFDKAKLKSDDKDESVFDRDLEEIIYFFEETKYEIVLIEDLDRFDNSEIFVKLRELNILLNNYKSFSSSGRKVKFIYAVLDEMFTDTERTKFFDIIIPIVPYINSTNSCNLLIRRFDELRKMGFKSDISEEFITKIAIFVDDMRLLYSVVNEFVIYKKTLGEAQKVSLNDEKMLALMIFKNLYPLEFSKLEKEEGAVKEAFAHKKAFIFDKSKQIDTEINSIKEKLSEAERDVLKDERELKAAFLEFLSGGIGSVLYVRVSNHQYQYAEIMRDDFDLTQLKNDTLAVGRVNLGKNFGQQGEVFYQPKDKDNFTRVNEYISRWENRKKYLGKEREHWIQAINEKQDKLLNLGGEKLSSLIETYGIKEVVASDEVNSNDLLVFLLRNGYIDETYPIYINYFHPDSINLNEYNFILNVTNHGESLEYDINLPNVDKVCRRISESEFRQEAILNFDLIDYMLTLERGNKKRDNLLEVLSWRGASVTRFITAYLNRNKNIDSFISSVVKTNEHFWDDIYLDAAVSESAKDNFFVLMIQSVSREEYPGLDKEKSISKYLLERREVFSGISKLSSEVISNVIDDLGVSFVDTDLSFIPEEVFRTIVDYSHYQININMLAEIVKRINEEAYLRFAKSNYGSIKLCKSDTLLRHIYNNIEEYVTQVYLPLEENSDDNVEDYIELIGKVGIFNDLTYQILGKVRKQIPKLQCMDELVSDGDEGTLAPVVEYCLANEKCLFSYDNVEYAYDWLEMAESLIDYISKHRREMKTWEPVSEYNEDFLNSIIYENRFDDEEYEDLMRLFENDMPLGDIRIEDVSDTHLQLLISKKYLPLSSEVYERLNQRDINYLVEYLETNSTEYISQIDEYPDISADLFAILLKSKTYSKEDKAKLVLKVSFDNISGEIALFIRDEGIRVNKDYFECIWNMLPIDKRYEFLWDNLDEFENSELPKYFEQLEGEFAKLADRKRHKVSLFKNEYNVKILRKLETREYVGGVGFETITNKKRFVWSSEETEERIYCWVKTAR